MWSVKTVVSNSSQFSKIITDLWQDNDDDDEDDFDDEDVIYEPEMDGMFSFSGGSMI